MMMQKLSAAGMYVGLWGIPLLALTGSALAQQSTGRKRRRLARGSYTFTGSHATWAKTGIRRFLSTITSWVNSKTGSMSRSR